MPLTLPNLDDVTWEQLTKEALSLIPGYAPDWTNFNASDPGITFLELLAHFSEILLFRTDQITDRQTELFLRLLNGPAWRPSQSLDDERYATLLSLDIPRRAVTARDFEELCLRATEATDGRGALPLRNRVARAKCIADRNLEVTQDDSPKALAPGHISVVVVTHENPLPSAETVVRVKKLLDGARLITTRVHVVPPSFVTFAVHITLMVAATASADKVQEEALSRLRNFFDPLRGGFDGKGWPFGRNIYVSELYQLLSKIPGVDYVTPTIRPSDDEELDELEVGAAEDRRKQFNGANELEAIRLREHELAQLQIASDSIVVRRK